MQWTPYEGRGRPLLKKTAETIGNFTTTRNASEMKSRRSHPFPEITLELQLHYMANNKKRTKRKRQTERENQRNCEESSIACVPFLVYVLYTQW